MWFETTLGTKYEMPDMQTNYVDSVLKQLFDNATNISVINISEAVLILPKRILAKAGVGDRCSWEKDAD
jgi:hypothetical protein